MPPSPQPISPTSLPKRPPGSFGPLFGIIIVIAFLLLGAFYFWGARLNQQQTPLPYIPSDIGTTTP